MSATPRSATAATTAGRSRVDGIDGLRAIAMTMVIAQHCGLLPFGWAGVWLFFVISGYVITLGFVGGQYAGRGFAAQFLLFMRRRALRIVPAYGLYLAACAAVLAGVGGLARLADLPWLASFSFNWRMIFDAPPGGAPWGPFGHLWTLSVEQQFYLLFPLLAIAVVPRLRLALTVALICAGPLLRWAWSQALQGGAMADDPGRLAFAVYAATHCHLDAFLLGSLIARLEPRLRAATRLARWVWPLALGAALGYAVLYVLINQRLGAGGVEALRNIYSGILFGQQREVFGYIAVDLVAAAALVHVLLGWRGARQLAWAPLAWVGRVSYGGYLFHALVLWAFAQGLGGAVKSLPLAWRLLAFAAVWGVTVALASASMRWFEAPIARRWRSRPRPPAPAAAATAVGGAR